jgi:hypothetical protein
MSHCISCIRHLRQSHQGAMFLPSFLMHQEGAAWIDWTFLRLTLTTSAIQAMLPSDSGHPHLISKNQSPSGMWNVLRRYHDGLAG